MSDITPDGAGCVVSPVDAYDQTEYEMWLKVIKATTPGIGDEEAEADAIARARFAHAYRAENKSARVGIPDVVRRRRCVCGWNGEVTLDIIDSEVLTVGYHDASWVCVECGEDYVDRVKVSASEV